MSKKQTRIDEGCGSEFLADASYAGKLEIPCVKGAGKAAVPELILPFSLRNKKRDPKKYILLSEPDVDFNDILRHPKRYVSKMRSCAGIITLEPALFRTSNLTAQLAYIYRSRELYLCLQKEGLDVVSHVCWGDERSYAAGTLYERFAFLGLPKCSTVAIGTCGCLDTEQDRQHFKGGLAAMLKKLRAKAVLVFGEMPDSVFAESEHLTRFVPCWGGYSIFKSGSAA